MESKCYLCGRLVDKPEYIKREDKEVVNMTIAVPKKGKNDEADFFKCSLWGTKAKEIADNNEKGDAIGIKGNIRTRKNVINETNINMLEIIADEFISLDNEKVKQSDFKALSTFIGRIVRDPELNEVADGKKVSNITIAVQRGYKNSEGIYETDFIPVAVWGTEGENVTNYCKKGDLVSIDSTLTMKKNKIKDQEINMLSVNANHVLYLSKSHENIEEAEEEAILEEPKKETKSTKSKKSTKKKEEPSLEV